ncbi:hypothetical protein [Lactobacillus equicursoris]|uniref:hypothetical protein n=1 Tax=Lactobacillus equicursoris TaxID=420645 RepID=UPI002431A2BD|nr:hypothetical protein [Lactobacillus equicursoris]MDD6387118.1 hypothetical protein [Lactobacillus equicursoris]
MTNFKSVFKTMLKQKNKQALAYFAVGAIVSLVATIFFIFRYGLKNADSAAIGIGISAVVLLVVYIAFEFAVVLQAHRVSRSQTWQLVPAKKLDLLSANVLSGTISVFFMTLLCVVLFFFLLIPIMLQAKFEGSLFQGMGDVVKNGLFWEGLVWFILFAFVAVVANICFFLFLLDFTSALADFLPLKGWISKLVKVVILFILFFLGGGAMMFYNFAPSTFSFAQSSKGFSYSGQGLGDLWMLLLATVIYGAVFFGGEYLIMKYLTEGKDKF